MTFTTSIYQETRDGCIRSASVIVPLVLEALRPDHDIKVVDVGCGEGWFAREFVKHGCDVLALDASIQPARSDHTGPGSLTFGSCVFPDGLPNDDYDLAVCLEVLEHLTPIAGEETMAWMCKHAELILWSAAIPNQGGHGHINEQWPQYWADQLLYEGFETHEDLRWMIWDDDTVEPWYRQNLLLSGRPETLDYLDLARTPRPVPAVHPAIFNNHPIPEGWLCQECSQRWISKPTIPNTTGCPNCGVAKETT